MANVATIPAEGQILVNIEDMSMLKDIKKAISLLKGVGKITVPRRRKLYSAYELCCATLTRDACMKQRTWTICSDSVWRRNSHVHHQVYGRIQTPDEAYPRHAQHGHTLRLVQ